MSFMTSRAQRRQLERDNAKLPRLLEGVPRVEWPAHLAFSEHAPFAVWRSREFLVQAFEEQAPGVHCRLSINRTTVSGGRWVDGISWDELQRLKAECGLGDMWAVEIFPPDSDVVNVANIRHLWVLADPPDYGWHKAPE